MALATLDQLSSIQPFTPAAQNQDAWDNLTRRGIAVTAQAQGWQAGRWFDHTGWWQPLYDADGQALLNSQNGQPIFAFKNAQKGHDYHDAWRNYPKGSKFLMLPRHSLKTALAQAEGVLHLAEGKADTLSLWAAGLPNAAGLFGTSNLPADLAAQFTTWGVRRVVYYAHNDANGSGFKLAYKLAERLADSGITVQLFKLPQNGDGAKIDLNDLWIACEFQSDTFLHYLFTLLDPLISAPPAPPVSPKAARPVDLPNIFADQAAAKAEIKRRADCFEYMRLYCGEPKTKDSTGGKWPAPTRAERTASFHVYKGERGFWDFGNDSGGDIFDLDRLLHGGSFGEVLERLAQHYGVTLPTRQPQREWSRQFAAPDTTQASPTTQDAAAGTCPTLPAAHAAVLDRYGGRIGQVYKETAQAIFECAHQKGQSVTVAQVAATSGVPASRLWRALRKGLDRAFQTGPEDSAPDGLTFTNEGGDPIKEESIDTGGEGGSIRESKSTNRRKAAHRPASTLRPDLPRFTQWLLREVVAPTIVERHGLPRASVNWLGSLGFAARRAEARAVRLAYVSRLEPEHLARYEKHLEAAARELLAVYRRLRQRPRFEPHVSREERILALSQAGKSKTSIARAVGCAVSTVGNVELRHNLIRPPVRHWVEADNPAALQGDYTRNGGYIIRRKRDHTGVVTRALVQEAVPSRPMTEQEQQVYQTMHEAKLRQARQARAALKTDPEAQRQELRQALNHPKPRQEEATRCGHDLSYSVRMLELYERTFGIRPAVLDTARRAEAVVRYAQSVKLQEASSRDAVLELLPEGTLR